MSRLTLKQKKERGWYYIGSDKYYWKNCNSCGKEYQGVGSNFCSRKCSANLKVVEHTDGTVTVVLKQRHTGHDYGAQISAAKKGRQAHPNSIAAANNSRRGVKLTEEHKKKCSEALSGSKHPNWKEDRTLLKKNEKKHLDVQYQLWATSVKNRDGWTCRMCDGGCSGRLEAHHIYDWTNFPEKRYQIKNGITLCHAHHPRGRANEEKLRNLLMSIVELNSELI